MEKTIEKKKRNKLSIEDAFVTILGSLVILLIVAFAGNLHMSEQTVQQQEYEIGLLKLENAELSDSIEVIQDQMDEIYKLTWDNIDYWIDAFGISNNEIVRAQIYEETGNLTSSLCRSNHNLFGMRMPAVRETSAIGERSGFAYYGSYIESIRDYALWQHSRYIDETEDYYLFLVRIGYCNPDCDGYIRRLKNIQNNVLSHN